MNKKYIPLIWFVVIIVIAVVIFILIKTSNPDNGSILKDGMILSDPYFSDKVIAIHSISCSHCRIVIPILKQIEQENNLTFYYYDTSNKVELDEITKLNIVPQFVPTIIIYGKVYVGERTKQQYEESILIK